MVALLVGALLLGLLAQRAVLLARFDRSVDEALQQERGEVEQLAGGTNPATGEPFGADVAAIFDTFLARNLPNEGEVFLTLVDGQPYKATLAPGDVRLQDDPQLVARWASLTEGERGSVGTAEGEVRYLAVPLRADGASQGVFVVADFVRAERDEIESTIRTEAVVSLIVLVVAAGVAWWTAGRLLRPVRQLTDAAEGIDDTDLGRRIPVEGDDEIARLARRFNEMLDRLEGAFASQRAFVDDAGHELRTPITIVKGHLAVMGDDPEDRRRTMAVVDAELDRMARIVEDLLVLAKAEQPDFLRPEPVEAADLTTSLLVRAQALGPRRWALDECAVGPLEADAQRLTQAVLNLARNALEHTPDGTEVAIGSRWELDGLRLWVRDRGPGIPAAERDHVFERFGRGTAARPRSEGAGLGLAIARSVAEAHGGRLELADTPGGGATFTIVLPGLPPPPDLIGDEADDDRDEAAHGSDDQPAPPDPPEPRVLARHPGRADGGPTAPPGGGPGPDRPRPHGDDPTEPVPVDDVTGRLPVVDPAATPPDEEPR
jgi:signal transduction histidine kinase